jgi:hypothetical protein
MDCAATEALCVDGGDTGMAREGVAASGSGSRTSGWVVVDGDAWEGVVTEGLSMESCVMEEACESLGLSTLGSITSISGSGSKDSTAVFSAFPPKSRNWNGCGS